MPNIKENIGRRHCIPIIYTKGTHYEVGFDVGRTFSGLIHSFLEVAGPLNKEFIPLYETPEGRRVYEETLACVKERFPQYVEELQGTADGANVPFYKLFLLHMDNILPITLGHNSMNGGPIGCSTVCVNQPGEEILGHNEDALSETLNHFYLVSAHITSDEPRGRWGVREERFTSLCYAGHLPGYTMSYNHHGLVFSVNTLSASRLNSAKTPRYFITRALLAAENFEQAQKILRDLGCGAADGCSINMTFLRQEGDRLFHNAEMAPAEPGTEESQLSILTASPGEHLMHCNKYLRLEIPECDPVMCNSSIARMRALRLHPDPHCRQDVIDMLGDQTGSDFRVFQEFGDDDFVKTIAVGIFDCVDRTWTLYADNPKRNDPLIVLPLLLKKYSG